MVLLAGVAAHRIDDEVGMDVFPVRVCSHNDFVAGNLFRQLQGDLVSHLRGDRIVGTEGLHHVIVHPSAGAVVLALGVQKLLEGSLGNAVDAGDQRPALIIRLGRLAAVAENTTQTTYGLRASVFYEVNDCHPCHRLSLRRSDSKELTDA